MIKEETQHALVLPQGSRGSAAHSRVGVFPKIDAVQRRRWPPARQRNEPKRAGRRTPIIPNGPELCPSQWGACKPAAAIGGMLGRRIWILASLSFVKL